MNYIIKINGYQLELDKSVDFERVIQRNTIGNIADRQSSFTSTIKVYKTANNYSFFEFLDSPGVNSDLPYIVLRAEILNDAGMVVNKKGRAFIEKTDQDYIYLNIYDGFIDFLKIIENKTLDDLDLSLLNHDQTINSVINSWNDNEKYMYLISDYNGENILNSAFNIDYQVPAASIKHIWEKIFEFTGYDYNTDGVFNTPNFEDLYITYPRPVSNEIQLLDVVEQKNDFGFYIFVDLATKPKVLNFPYLLPQQVDNEYFKVYEQITDQSNPSSTGELPVVGEFKKTGIYKLSISGEFYIEFSGAKIIVTKIIYQVIRNGNILFDGKLNSFSTGYENEVDLEVQSGDTIKMFVLNEMVNDTTTIQDQSSFFFTQELHDNNNESNFVTNNNGSLSLGINTKISFKESVSVDFSNVFSKIKIRDFINDIMFRFGLTPFPDYKKNKIDFLLQESVFLSDVIDYSDSFVREEETRFAYNDYAKKNYFRYEYNDTEANHNDGAITVNNENIEFEKELYKSFFYSPKKSKSQVLGISLLKSNTWDRKIDEDSNIEYEELDGRYYLFKKELKNSLINLYSKRLGNTGSSPSFYKASFSGLDFQSILDSDYYRFTDKVIKNSKVRNVILYLTDLEFMNVDLKNRMYLKQYSSNFLINRIKNRSGESEYSFELIEINI